MALLNDVSGQPIAKGNIKAGYPEVFFAPAVTPVALDPLVDAGWRRLGQLAPGSLNSDFPQETLDVKAGFPETVQARFTTARAGTVDWVCHEYTPYALMLANGSTLTPTVVATTVAWAEVTSIASTLRNHVVLANADAAGLAVGDLLQIPQGNSATTGAWFNWLKVGAIGPADFVNGVASAGNTEIVLLGKTDFLAGSGITVTRIKGWNQTRGGNSLADYQLRYKISLTDGGIIVMHMPLGNFVNSMKEDMAEKSNLKIPMQFGALGIMTAVPSFGDQIVIATEYFRTAAE